MNLRLIHQDPNSNIVFVTPYYRPVRVNPPCSVETPLDPPPNLDCRTMWEVLQDGDGPEAA